MVSAILEAVKDGLSHSVSAVMHIVQMYVSGNEDYAWNAV